jgi:hypothetical protein
MSPVTSADPIVRVEGLTAGYADVVQLKDYTFAI